MIITRPLHCERDFLVEAQLTNHTFYLKNLNEEVIYSKEAPSGGWTHDTLESIECSELSPNDAWNAYLGSNWIGSSEV